VALRLPPKLGFL